MTPSVPRRTMLATVAAVAGLAAAMAADATAAQPRAGCSQLREKQHLRVTLSWRYTVKHSRVNSSYQLEVKTLADQTRVFATLDVAGATCKRPGGRWQVIDPVGVGYSSVGIDGAGNIRDSGLMKGWGIGIRSGAGGSVPRMALQIMHCGQGNFFSTLKAITGVPLPRVGFYPSLALWGAGKLLPKDKVKCGDVGVKPLRVYASRSGAMRVADLKPYGFGESVVIPSIPNNPNRQWTVEKAFNVKPIAVAGP